MEFNFDESSAAWLANKIRKGYSYVYKCEKCDRPAYNVQGNTTIFLCWNHRGKNNTRKNDLKLR